MLIDLNKPAKDLDGNDVPETNLARNLAAAMSGAQASNPMRMWKLAKDLHAADGPIEVTQEELRALIPWLDGACPLPVFMKAQILEELQRALESQIVAARRMPQNPANG